MWNIPGEMYHIVPMSYIYVRIYICIYIYTVYTNTYIYTIHMCMYTVYICVHTHIYIYVCIYVFVYVYIEYFRRQMADIKAIKHNKALTQDAKEIHGLSMQFQVQVYFATSAGLSLLR